MCRSTFLTTRPVSRWSLRSSMSAALSDYCRGAIPTGMALCVRQPTQGGVTAHTSWRFRDLLIAVLDSADQFVFPPAREMGIDLHEGFACLLSHVFRRKPGRECLVDHTPIESGAFGWSQPKRWSSRTIPFLGSCSILCHRTASSLSVASSCSCWVISVCKAV